MATPPVDLPDDIDALRAVAAVALAQNADDAALITEQKLEIAKLKRQIYGPRSERASRLIEQLELELADAGAAATEDEILAFARDRLAKFKMPRTVVFTELPKTSTGKIQKFVLRERAKKL